MIGHTESIEATVPRWLLWTNAFAFGFVIVTEFTHFYCATTFLAMLILGVFAATVIGVFAGLLAYSFQRDGIAIFPTTADAGGWRALLAGAAMSYVLHIFGH